MEAHESGLDELHEAMIVDDELAATDQFLRTSIRLLGQLGFMGRDEYVVTTLLASGSEKLLKLTLGFIRSDVEFEPWPSKELVRHGHRIESLDQLTRRIIQSRRQVAVATHAVDDLYEALNRDPYIAKILALAGDYAAGGRFYNLDYLGRAGSDRPSPRERWQGIFNAVWADNLDEHHRWHPMVTFADISATNARNRRLQESVALWREYYLTAWGQGICGPRARRLAEDLTDANPNL